MEKGRTIVTLTGPGRCEVKRRWPCLLLLAGVLRRAQMRTVALPGKSPLVTFRIVFTTGAAADPADKPGLAYLTAQMLADGGTKDLTYKQVVDAMFPMAAARERAGGQGDDHLQRRHARGQSGRRTTSCCARMLLDPGWREDDFRRVKDDAINALKVGLRGNNDEELGKEVLYETHLSGHAVRALQRRDGFGRSRRSRWTIVKAFYKQHYTQSNLILGHRGRLSAGSSWQQMKKDFAGAAGERRTPGRGMSTPAPIEHTRAVIVDKDTRAVAYSFGYPDRRDARRSGLSRRCC